MKIFSPLYERALVWARHKYAPRYLAALSFAESSFFPVPPDVMLAPMVLATPVNGWRFAMITTVMSVVGGVAGYLIGWLAFEAITPILKTAGYWQDYQDIKIWFSEWGVWVILIAGFSPIPYKVFTIAAGAVALSFPVFVVASIIARGARFYLVAALIIIGGEKMEAGLRRYIDVLGWAVVILLGVLYLFFR